MAGSTTINLKVTNNNDFTISDRFDGVPFEIEPGKSVTLPADAAAHLFGWQPGIEPRAMFLHVQKRWGWNTPEMVSSGKAEKFFANLEFKPVTFRMVEVVEPDFEEVPEPQPQPRVGGKFAKREGRAEATA